MDRATMVRIEALIAKLPDIRKWEKDDAVSAEFAKLAEEPALPEELRDFCIDASLLAGGNDVGPFGNATKEEVRRRFVELKNGLR